MGLPIALGTPARHRGDSRAAMAEMLSMPAVSQHVEEHQMVVGIQVKKCRTLLVFCLW